ncbi:MAG: L-lactate permease, partial [Oscillospiraceae bacterium]|nr:L-lactate permease [Oscillospiraceae bacterium]
SPMWTFNSITILLTGLCVCFVYDGVKGVVKGLPKVIPAWAVMTAVQFAILHLEIFSLATLMTALVGLCTMFGLYKLRFGKSGESEMVGKSVGLTHPIRDNSKTRPTLLQATLPYILIMVLLLSFQFIPPEIRNKVAISPSFPAVTTSKGYETAAESGFNPIKLFVHPAFALALSALTACIIFKKAKIWDSSVFKTSASKTVKKGVPATLALLAFGHMSLIMMDSGMMFRLAKSVADLTGKFYPLAAPFIGVLGSFMTGNNTNSNVMFGRLQQTVAAELGLSEAVMASVQSISGGLGCAIASTLVYMAALATRQPENVPAVLRKLIPLVLIIAAVMGSLNYVINR